MTEEEYKEQIQLICGPDFLGLYGEVVTHDTYRIRSLSFVPDLVLDIGANVGFFSRFAHQLFPSADIVSVEPDFDNGEKFVTFPPISDTWNQKHLLLRVALGKGKLYRGTTARNGSGATYLSTGLGYPAEEMKKAAKGSSLEVSYVYAFTVARLLTRLGYHPSQKVLLKIDCEGAENTIWDDAESMAVLHQMEYICMELHDYAINTVEQEKVRKRTTEALQELETTHICEREGVHFWATKRI